MGPPSSNATLVPECGGNSNSFRLMPAEMTVVSINVRSAYWVVMGVLSGNPSKSRTVDASSGAMRTAAASRNVVHRNLGFRSIS